MSALRAASRTAARSSGESTAKDRPPHWNTSRRKVPIATWRSGGNVTTGQEHEKSTGNRG